MGRWAMEFELGPLLERAIAEPTRRPLILASLRDILQVPKDPAKVERSVAICARYYDALLVQGDRRLVVVEESYPAIAPFLGRVHYTGLVAPPPPPAGEPTVSGVFDVLVTGGGGAIAESVLRSAIAAKAYTELANARWLALAGPKMPEPAFAALREYAVEQGVTVERFHPDLVHLMRHARLSLQRAGYNTVCDLLVAGCRAILVPDAEHGQREQPLRAERLAAIGRAVVIDENHLDPPHLAAAIEAALAQDVASVDLDLDGARRSARLVMELAACTKPG